MPHLAAALEGDGFAHAAAILAAHDVDSLTAFFAQADLSRSERSGKTYGARNLLAQTEIHRIAVSGTLAVHLRPLLGAGFQAVRGLFFDKTEGANWPVLWHQDLSLAMKAQSDIPGWGNWSVKRGVPHVQPPASILESMVTVRLHLDDCPAQNGPLRVLPGSHRSGVLSRARIQALVASQPEQVLTAMAGDALFMKPLILHASSPAVSPEHRRVLHLEFAPAGLLPNGLEWAETA